MKKGVVKKDKYRHELKYMITDLQFEELKSRLSSLLQVDKNARKTGSYFIRSLYFDDHLNTSYYQVLNGVSKREKYRIRYYNFDESYISLEKKFKINNMTNKTSCRVTRNQVEDLISGKLDISKDNHKLLNEFIIKTKFYGYKPAVIVDYNRIPYTYVAGNVRITLDYNIAMNYNVEEFFKRNGTSIPVLDKCNHILEVKYDEFLPNHISWLVNINTLEQTSYSKYLSSRLIQNKIKTKEIFYE